MAGERSKPMHTPERAGSDPQARRAMAQRGIESASQPRSSERLRRFDPFEQAIAPPQGWRENELFLLDFDAKLLECIQRSPLGDVQSYQLKDRLGLAPHLISEEALRTPAAVMLHDLSSELATYPGRLVHGNKEGMGANPPDIAGYRTWLMQRAVYLFAREQKSVDTIVTQYFGGNNEAELLLKDGIAEVLRTRSEHDRDNGVRWQ